MQLIKYGDRQRSASLVLCENCGKEFLKANIDIRKTKRHYCSENCYREANKSPTVELKCAACGKPFMKRIKEMSSKSGLYFCCRSCKDASQHIDGLLCPAHYGTSETYYRATAFRNYEKKCEHCGYDQHEQGLEVHHIDENHNNNIPENLIVLCATCHRLLTFGVMTMQDRKLIEVD